jgi:hypothetical protein
LLESFFVSRRETAGRGFEGFEVVDLALESGRVAVGEAFGALSGDGGFACGVY